MKTKTKKADLPEYAPDSVYEMIFKKGMQCYLLIDEKNVGSKRGDIVTITTVTSIFKGFRSDGSYSDYEMLRVSNGKYTWRISRSYLLPL